MSHSLGTNKKNYITCSHLYNSEIVKNDLENSSNRLPRTCETVNKNIFQNDRIMSFICGMPLI